MGRGEVRGALLVVDVEQDEAEEDCQHAGKHKASAIVGHVPQVALPEPATHQLQHPPFCNIVIIIIAPFLRTRSVKQHLFYCFLLSSLLALSQIIGMTNGIQIFSNI